MSRQRPSGRQLPPLQRFSLSLSELQPDSQIGHEGDLVHRLHPALVRVKNVALNILALGHVEEFEVNAESL